MCDKKLRQTGNLNNYKNEREKRITHEKNEILAIVSLKIQSNPHNSVRQIE